MFRLVPYRFFFFCLILCIVDYLAAVFIEVVRAIKKRFNSVKVKTVS